MKQLKCVFSSKLVNSSPGSGKAPQSVVLKILFPHIKSRRQAAASEASCKGFANIFEN